MVSEAQRLFSEIKFNLFNQVLYIQKGDLPIFNEKSLKAPLPFPFDLTEA